MSERAGKKAKPTVVKSNEMGYGFSTYSLLKIDVLLFVLFIGIISCADWNPPQMYLSATNFQNKQKLLKGKQMKYNTNFIGQLANDGQLNIFHKKNLTFLHSLHANDNISFNTSTKTKTTTITNITKFIDYDFVQGEDVLAGISKTFSLQISIVDKQKKIFDNVLSSDNDSFSKVQINQHSTIILQKQGKIFRYNRKQPLQKNIIPQQFDQSEGQIFIYLSQNIHPSEQQKEILGQSVSYYLTSDLQSQYIILKQNLSVIVIQCKIGQYQNSSCRQSFNETFYQASNGEIIAGFDYSGKNMMLQFKSIFYDFITRQNKTGSEDGVWKYKKTQVIYDIQYNKIQRQWLMDYNRSRSLVLLEDTGFLQVFSYGDPLNNSKNIHNYTNETSYVQGLPSPGTLTDAFYDIRDEKFYTLSEGVLKSFAFGCTDQVSYYWPVVSCIMCEDQCLTCNNVTGDCIELKPIPQPQPQQTIIQSIQSNSQQTIMPQQQSIQQESIEPEIEPEIVQPQKDPQSPSQQSKQEGVKHKEYLTKKQKFIITKINDYMDQASQNVTYFLWTVSALPFSTFFLSFINFWTICSFYAFQEIGMPEFLEDMLKEIFVMINSSLLKFLNIDFQPSLQIAERLSPKLVENFQISSDIVQMSSQNIVVCLFSILLIAIFQFISTNCKKKSNLKNNQSKQKAEIKISFFEMYLGQTINFFPFIMIGFCMLKNTSFFRNLPEKINIIAYQVSISLIVALPFLILGYEYPFKHNKQQNKKKEQQKQFLFHKKLKWFYLIQCNVLIPMTALLSIPVLSLTLRFGLFGFGFYLALKSNKKRRLRKINQVIQSLQLIILNSLFLGIKIAGDLQMPLIKKYLAFGCCGTIVISTFHQVLTLIIIDILIDKIWILIKKICSKCNANKIKDTSSSSLTKNPKQQQILKGKKKQRILFRATKNNQKKSSVKHFRKKLQNKTFVIRKTQTNDQSISSTSQFSFATQSNFLAKKNNLEKQAIYQYKSRTPIAAKITMDFKFVKNQQKNMKIISNALVNKDDSIDVAVAPVAKPFEYNGFFNRRWTRKNKNKQKMPDFSTRLIKQKDIDKIIKNNSLAPINNRTKKITI